MKKLVFVILNVGLAFNLAASEVIDFDFNRVTNCKGEFGYEEVFLLTGRPVGTKLDKDPEATKLVSTIHFGLPLVPVTEAYTIELFPTYAFYSAIKSYTKRLGIVLAKQPPHSRSEFQYQLLLVITEGSNKGHIQAAHQATLDFEANRFLSDRFACDIQ